MITQKSINALANANNLHEKKILIKVGGSILDNEAAIENLCADIKVLTDAGMKLVLVHGGSKAINRHLAIHNIESSFVDSLRVTSAAAMTIIEMVLCGNINKLLVRKLNSFGINAVGISGTDNAMLQCDYYSKTHGYVGAVKKVNPVTAIQLMSTSIPVIAPIGVDKTGNAMNINADYAASHLASALNVDQLIYLTDQDGIYDPYKSIYPELSNNDLRRLITKKIVADGMLVKTKAILSALNNGFCQVLIMNGNSKNILLRKILASENIGTICKSHSSFHDSLEAAL